MFLFMKDKDMRLDSNIRQQERNQSKEMREQKFQVGGGTELVEVRKRWSQKEFLEPESKFIGASQGHLQRIGTEPLTHLTQL